MRLLDRLDDLDRGMGFVRTPKRAPSRLGRLMARHPWRTAALYVVLIALPQIVNMGAAGHRPRLVAVVIFFIFSVPLGLVVGFSARNAVARWERREDPEGEAVASP